MTEELAQIGRVITIDRRRYARSPEENEYGSVHTSKVETLLISGELDFSTPPQLATEELLPYLPNGHQVVLEEFGHTASF